MHTPASLFKILGQTLAISLLFSLGVILPYRSFSDSPPTAPCQAAVSNLARRFLQKSGDFAVRAAAAVARADEWLVQLPGQIRDVFPAFGIPKDIKNFNMSRFDEAVAYFEKQFRVGSELSAEEVSYIRRAARSVKNVEDQLALLHVAEKHARSLRGIDEASSTVKEILAAGTKAQKRMLDDLAQEIAVLDKSSDKLPRPDQVRDWTMRLYEIQNLPPSFLGEVAKLGKDKAVRAATARILDDQIEKADDVFKAFEKMGLVEASVSSGTKVKRAKDIATTLLHEATANSALYLNHVLVHFPKLNRTKAALFSNYVKKGLAEGKSLAELKPELQRLIGRGAEFDALYNSFRGAHNLAWKIALTYTLKETSEKLFADQQADAARKALDNQGQGNLRKDDVLIEEQRNDPAMKDALAIFAQDFAQPAADNRAVAGEGNPQPTNSENPKK